MTNTTLANNLFNRLPKEKFMALCSVGPGCTIDCAGGCIAEYNSDSGLCYTECFNNFVPSSSREPPPLKDGVTYSIAANNVPIKFFASRIDPALTSNDIKNAEGTISLAATKITLTEIIDLLDEAATPK